MVTDAMIEAGVNAFGRTETLSVRKLLEVAYPAMHAARPTADLGEDGELIAKLRAVDSGTDELGGDIGTNSYRNPDGPEAADRLILYREALERIASFEANGAGANYYFEQVWELVDIARAVLRSGG